MRISETPSPTGPQSPKFPACADSMRCAMRARAFESLRHAATCRRLRCARRYSFAAIVSERIRLHPLARRHAQRAPAHARDKPARPPATEPVDRVYAGKVAVARTRVDVPMLVL